MITPLMGRMLRRVYWRNYRRIYRNAVEWLRREYPGDPPAMRRRIAADYANRRAPREAAEDIQVHRGGWFPAQHKTISG